MNFFIALGYRNSLAPVKRDHIKLRDPIVWIGRLFTGLSSFSFAALGEKGDPPAIRRPLRLLS